MSEMWIQHSEKILKHIKESGANEEKDRLDYIKSIRFMLNALNRSLVGWIQWINNPDVMTKFTEEELEDVNKILADLICSFIEYDLKISRMGAEKRLKARKMAEKRNIQGTNILYI